MLLIVETDTVETRTFKKFGSKMRGKIMAALFEKMGWKVNTPPKAKI